MRNYKRFLAIAMATTMVFGSSLTAFAADPDDTTTTTAPATQGETEGVGTNEGHVNKHVVNVTLPVVKAGSTPFAYTMDLERLVDETNAGKYEDASFTADAKAKGVYFLTAGEAGADTYEAVTEAKKDDIGTYYEKSAKDTYKKTEDTALDDEKTYYEEDAENAGEYKAVASPEVANIASYYEKETEDVYALTEDEDVISGKTYYTKKAGAAGKVYDNKSEALSVISASSVDVKLTVDVEVTSQTTDAELVDAAPADSVKTPQLYLALKVGDQTKAIKKDGKTTAEVTIAGKDGNFETVVKNGAYSYEAKEGTEEAPITWNSADISLTGAASKASAENVTAPTLKVTWKWSDPTAGPQVSVAADGKISVTGLTESKAYKAMSISDGTNTYGLDSDKNVTWDMSGFDSTKKSGALGVQLKDAWLSESIFGGKDVTVTVTLSDDTTVKGTVKLNKK